MNWALVTLLAVILILILVLMVKMTKAPIVSDRAYKQSYRIEAITKAVKEYIDDKINEDLKSGALASLAQSELDKREIEQKRLEKNVLECGQGDPSQKKAVKDKIKDILQKQCGVTSKNIDEIISFNEPSKMTAQDKWEYMYAVEKIVHKVSHRTFKSLDDKVHFYAEKTDANGRVYFEVTGEDVENAYEAYDVENNFLAKLECVAQRIYQILYGHGPADILTSDYSFDDIEGGVGGRLRDDFDYHAEIRKKTDGYENTDEDEDAEKNGDSEGQMYYDVVSARYKGKLARFSFLSFGTPGNLERVVNIIYLNNPSGVLCENNTSVQSTLKDAGESRVFVVCPPETNFSFYVRHPASNEAIALEELVKWPGCEPVREVLKNLIRGEFNTIITGNTGGGKTTLLKALVKYVDPTYEIRTVESGPELNLNNIYPKKNVHALVETANQTIYDCLAQTKKTNTDLLITGEVNSPELAGAHIQAAQSGSTMSLTTMHPRSTDKCVAYMRNAMVTNCGINDVRVATEQVIDAFNFDIRQVRDSAGHHYIEHISEIVPINYGEYSDDTDENTKQYHERVTDRRLYEVNRIIEFDREHMEYHVVGNFSNYSLERLAEKIGVEKTKEIKKLLTKCKVDRIDYMKLLEQSLAVDDEDTDDELAAYRADDERSQAAG